MGMDVYGTKPTDPVGEYFRNNVWWWRPLWDYCLNNHGKIAGKVEYGHSNDGDGLDAKEARKLGSLLRQDIASGFAAKYEKDYNEMIESLEKIVCERCNNTGKVKYTSVGDNESERKCHACEGTGMIVDFRAHYPFSVENLQAFADFCFHSGGFSIC